MPSCHPSLDQFLYFNFIGVHFVTVFVTRDSVTVPELVLCPNGSCSRKHEPFGGLILIKFEGPNSVHAFESMSRLGTVAALVLSLFLEQIYFFLCYNWGKVNDL